MTLLYSHLFICLRHFLYPSLYLDLPPLYSHLSILISPSRALIYLFYPYPNLCFPSIYLLSNSTFTYLYSPPLPLSLSPPPPLPLSLSRPPPLISNFISISPSPSVLSLSLPWSLAVVGVGVTRCMCVNSLGVFCWINGRTKRSGRRGTR